MRRNAKKTSAYLNSVQSTLLHQLYLHSSCRFGGFLSQSMGFARKGLPVRQLFRGRACLDTWPRAVFLTRVGGRGCVQPECLRVLRALGVGMGVVAVCGVSVAFQ